MSQLSALADRRLLAVVRGWAPFVMLLVAYELMRDAASALGMPAHDLARLDRTLFDGYQPTLVLQAAIGKLADAELFEETGSLVYATHFLLPVAVGAWLWTKDREAFRRFALTLVVLGGLAFVTYVIAPTAPPVAGSAHRGPPRDRTDHPAEWHAVEPGLAVLASRLQPLRGIPFAACRLPRGRCGRRLAAEPQGRNGLVGVGRHCLGRGRLSGRALRGRRHRWNRLCRSREDDRAKPGRALPPARRASYSAIAGIVVGAASEARSISSSVGRNQAITSVASTRITWVISDF